MNNPTDWIGWMPSRDELTRAAEADEIKRLKAYRNTTALAWTKLTESQEQEIEQLKEENARLWAELARASCPVRGPGPDK